MQVSRAHVLTTSLSRLSLALALGLGATAGAQAQSLEDLYKAARAYDATYLSARAQAESAEYKAAQSDALARPTLGVGVTDTYTRIQEPIIGTIKEDTVQPGLTGSYTLFNRANGFTIDQAHRGVAQAQAQFVLAEQDLIVRVAQAYFDVLAAEDTLNTSRADKAAIAEQLASAKRNFEVGTSTITDTREAQARYDLAVATDLANENDLRVKRVVLDQIVGHGGVEPKGLAQPVALPALPSDNIDTWVAEAERHPSVQVARLNLEIAELETKKSHAGNDATATLTATAGAQNLHIIGLPEEYAEEEGAGFSKTATLGLNITLPLYTGGQVTNRIKETEKLEEKARDDLDFASRMAVQNTRSAFLSVESLQSQVKAYEAAEASSKLSLEATQLGYKVGVRVNLDVLNAQTQFYTAEASLAKARYDTVVTGLKLRQAAGTLQPDDVNSVNALLVK